MKLLGIVWFSGRHAIGVALAINAEGVLKAFIETVSGNDEPSDIKHILEWGSKFPVREAVALIEKRGSFKVTAKEWVKLVHTENGAKA